ncbi:DUF4238 domain-containing protein [Mastigocoleus sp. MO_188.B34]|uniref:DUF4238 domain-containing protein n=1 Tax=Mastigocoleus sp. MO_188.B34 TaxID=3036635 RepID=UPI00262516B3|nr:DUF4238 domain-containing protein [Mastigocoleus sp. MO_188.B34]MDJ0696918.1 DUF4238 domain-containing protein [Mastigocoleus sp. MO_188.B34]
MSKVLNQHYVPQSYLKNFSSDGKKKIFVFDKFEQKNFSSHVRNVASERGFYDFPADVTSTEDIQIMEQYFSALEDKQNKFLKHLEKKILKKIDRKINKILKSVLNHNDRNKYDSSEIITKSEKQDLASIVAIQFLRTREFRNFLIDMQKATESINGQILEQKVLNIISEYEQAFSIKFTEPLIDTLKKQILNISSEQIDYLYSDGLPFVHAKFILDNWEICAKHLQNHIWMIGINDTGKPLFTSDHPVARYAHLDSNGIISEGIELTFPLNSRIILIMRDKRYFYRCMDGDNKLFPLTIDDIENYNKLQICNSNRFVFCSEDSFELVENICKKYPGACSEDKIRVETSKI